MADDQKPKTMDINDLVRELSKSSTTPVAPTPPLAPPIQAPRPSFPSAPSAGSGPLVKPVTPAPMVGSPMAGIPPVVPKPFVPMPSTPPTVNPLPPKPFIPVTPIPAPIKPLQSKPLETSRPQVNTPLPPFNQSKPAPAPVVLPPPTSGVKEYQSSIRTMSEDISKLKLGQKPMGVDVPRKVEQTPVVKPVVPQPTNPSQQFKIPNVNLGEAQKTGPLAQTKDIKLPGTQKVEPTKPQIYVPPAGGDQRGLNRNMLFIGIGVVAIVAGFSYWFFVLRLPSPEVAVETPTPLATETPAPTPTPTLDSIFSGTPKQNIALTPKDTLAFFVGDIMGKVVVDPESFKEIQALDAQMSSVSYNFSELMTKLALNIPGELMSNFGTDSAMFVYGQKESFDSKGNLKVGTVAPNRVVIVAEIKDPSGVSQVASTWEATLSSDLNALFALGKTSKVQTGFLDNLYRGVSIRYRNFPYADMSIDYSFVPASNGKNYFVVTNSREAMYATIDKLK